MTVSLLNCFKLGELRINGEYVNGRMYIYRDNRFANTVKEELEEFYGEAKKRT